ncbi:MAG: hypothetical protein CVU46_17990 [Chloroflexi bacterium HGW-Chloroflexi-8]|nr:MAG: hypothetical protein CVU46_17990 [Chloroflexi bacterium HGW-Chloroflexi-8]
MIFSFNFIQQVLFFLAAVIVLFLPGMVWIAWTKPNGRDWIERFSDALGISIALISIIAMLFFFLGLQFSWLILFVLYSACLVFLVAAILMKQLQVKKTDLLVWVGLFFALTGMILWRFYQARTLAFPAWVDSVHHVLIVQKILDARGIPATLAPELPIKFTYHFGFHIVTAIWSALTNLRPVDSVLWLGQVLNALISLGIYRVAKQTWKDTRVAILAALLVAFAFNMPAYYLTWGRYTLITGLLCMLPAMAASIELVHNQFRWELFWRLVILSCGLALVHYMALLFFGIFVGCLFLVNFLETIWKKQRPDHLIKWGHVWFPGFASLFGILLAAPWLVRMLSDQAASATVRVIVPTWENFKNSFQYIWYLLGPNFNYWLIGLAGLGLLLAWFQKTEKGVSLWATIMILLSVPWGLKLGPFRPDHMAIVMFIPAAWFLAYGLIFFGERVFIRRGKAFSNFLITAVVLGVLIWGGWQTRNILNSVTILADQDDRKALEWIERNAPVDARFFANTTPWQYSTYRGVDGGYWITSMTKRFSLAMPSLYAYGDAELKEEWKQWITEASEINSCGDRFWALVREANLNFIYLHKGKGKLSPAAMENCFGVAPLYHQGDVWIYKINQDFS